MSEPYLTMAEIVATYPDEWVLIDNAKLSRYQEVLGGRVVLHCPDRAEFLRRFDDWDHDSLGRQIATWYTGAFPADELLPADPEPGVA